MSTDPLIPQNDASIRHTTRLDRPSFLKDPKTLFDTSKVKFSDGEDISNDQQLTWLLPAVSHLERINKKESFAKQKNGHPLLIWQVIKDSGICAIVSCLSPLISLLLTLFLIHHLSRGDYAVLVILNTAVVLLSFGLIVMRRYLFK
jgi:hypothetical protein